MRLMVRDGNDLIESKEFTDQRISIGSDPECEVRIQDRRVLPRHATLIPIGDGGWKIEGAVGGETVLLNGRPVVRPTPIKPSDEIDIFNYTIGVYRSAGGGFEDRSKASSRVSPQAAELQAKPLPPDSVIKRQGAEMTLSGADGLWLANVAFGLADCEDIPRLIDCVLDRVLDAFGGSTAYVGMRRKNYGSHEYVEGRGSDGKIAPPPHNLDSLLVWCCESQQLICMPRTSNPNVGSAMAVPLTCSLGEVGILYVARSPSAEAFDVSDLDRLTAVAGVYAVKLEGIILEQVSVREAVELGQVSFVRELQSRMDPTSVPQWPGVQLAVYCKPGSDRGGDIYDVMGMPNGLASIVVANVLGESTRAAIAMSEIRAAFRIAGLHADAPHVFLRAVNWMLCEDRARTLVNSVSLVMNPRTGTFDCCAVGEIGALIVDGRGDTRDLSDHTVPPAGRTPGVAYGSKTDRLEPGETLALFTTGCFSVCDAAGEAFGEERFVECVRDGFGQPASTALAELVQDHSAYFKDGRQPDDITILLFHRVLSPT